jgi:hypothetical protein
MKVESPASGMIIAAFYRISLPIAQENRVLGCISRPDSGKVTDLWQQISALQPDILANCWISSCNR